MRRQQAPPTVARLEKPTFGKLGPVPAETAAPADGLGLEDVAPRRTPA